MPSELCDSGVRVVAAGHVLQHLPVLAGERQPGDGFPAKTTER